MANMSQKMIAVVMAVVISGLLLGYVFPVGLDALNDDVTYDYSVDNQTTTEVVSGLELTVNGVTADTSATIELNDTETGTTEEYTINEGDTQAYTQLNQDVNVTLDNATATTATGTVSTETGYGWSDGSKSVYGALGIFLVLVPLVVMARLAMDA